MRGMVIANVNHRSDHLVVVVCAVVIGQVLFRRSLVVDYNVRVDRSVVYADHCENEKQICVRIRDCVRRDGDGDGDVYRYQDHSRE